MSTINRLMRLLPDSWGLADNDSSTAAALQAGYADALDTAGADVAQALEQMSVNTADGEWLEEWGGYFGVARLPGEPDAEYAPRMIAEVLRPRCNNAALAGAIEQAFGQVCSVQDVVSYRGVLTAYDGSIGHNGSSTYEDPAGIPKVPHDGSIKFDGSEKYGDSASAVNGLFDVAIGYALDYSLDPTEFAAVVRSFVDRFRSAGTHMRSLSLGSSALSSQVEPCVDEVFGVVVESYRYSGTFRYSGSIAHTDTGVRQLA